MTDGSRRASPGFDLAVATGKGDDGTTGLLYGGERIAKDDPRAEAYGTIDEAVAALGLARAELGLKQELDRAAGLAGIADLVLRLQRELFVVGAELATNRTPGIACRTARRGSRRRWSRGSTRSCATSRHMSRCRASSSSRASRARAPRSSWLGPSCAEQSGAVALRRDGLVPGPYLLPYLNRPADLLWVLARAVEQAEFRRAPPSRPGRRRNSEEN